MEEEKMPKYSKEELAGMARSYLMARVEGDPRCDHVIDALVERTGLAGAHCEVLIHKLAMGFEV